VLSTERRLNALRVRMEKAYFDKLDGAIEESFWSRMQQDWQQDEMRLEQKLMALR